MKNKESERTRKKEQVFLQETEMIIEQKKISHVRFSQLTIIEAIMKIKVTI